MACSVQPVAENCPCDTCARNDDLLRHLECFGRAEMLYRNVIYVSSQFIHFCFVVSINFGAMSSHKRRLCRLASHGAMLLCVGEKGVSCSEPLFATYQPYFRSATARTLPSSSLDGYCVCDLCMRPVEKSQRWNCWSVECRLKQSRDTDDGNSQHW